MIELERTAIHETPRGIAQPVPGKVMVKYTTFGITVAVVDSGLDIMHPDIAANVFTNPAEYSAMGWTTTATVTSTMFMALTF